MKAWTFLEAYDYIKAHPEQFELCGDEEELSGHRRCICVYFTNFTDPISGSYAGKLRWRTHDNEVPHVDEELQIALNNYERIHKEV